MLRYHTADQVQDVLSRIDEYLNTNHGDLNIHDEWKIEPCFPSDRKWQKNIDVFAFKIYEPVENNSMIPLVKRNRIQFKFEIYDEDYVVTTVFPPDWPHATNEKQLNNLLKKFSEAVDKKDSILQKYRKFIKKD